MVLPILAFYHVINRFNQQVQPIHCGPMKPTYTTKKGFAKLASAPNGRRVRLWRSGQFRTTKTSFGTLPPPRHGNLLKGLVGGDDKP